MKKEWSSTSANGLGSEAETETMSVAMLLDVMPQRAYSLLLVSSTLLIL